MTIVVDAPKFDRSVGVGFRWPGTQQATAPDGPSIHEFVVRLVLHRSDTNADLNERQFVVRMTDDERRNLLYRDGRDADFGSPGWSGERFAMVCMDATRDGDITRKRDSGWVSFEQAHKLYARLMDRITSRT